MNADQKEELHRGDAETSSQSEHHPSCCRFIQAKYSARISMKPLRLTAHRFAMGLHVPATRIAEIIHERRGITADTAIRLGRYFKTTPRFWLNLQTAYDLETIER